MTKNLFDIISEHDEAITKEANPLAMLGGMLLRGAGGIGRAVLSRPGAALGAAMSASDVAGGAKRFSGMAAKGNRSNPFNP